MPYCMIEELQSRRKEKVAVFLTFENIVGLIVVFFPIFLGSGGLPLLIRAPLCAAAAVLGVAVTLEVHGLPIYEQALWRARGAIRLRLRGNLIAPDELGSAAIHDTSERPLAVDGPIQAVTRAAGRPPTPPVHPLSPVQKNGATHADIAVQ